MHAEMRSCHRLILVPVFAAGSCLLSSCASPSIVLQPVGPGPIAASTSLGQGVLLVYSDTDEKHLDQSSAFYVHSSYVIETPKGRQVRWVQNHLSVMDERPQRVSMPAGTYEVVARSEDYGRVRVPVVIESGRITEVHLVDTWKPRAPVSDPSRLVRFPNGLLIGWAAPATAEWSGSTSNPR